MLTSGVKNKLAHANCPVIIYVKIWFVNTKNLRLVKTQDTLLHFLQAGNSASILAFAGQKKERPGFRSLFVIIREGDSLRGTEHTTKA